MHSFERKFQALSDVDGPKPPGLEKYKFVNVVLRSAKPYNVLQAYAKVR